MMFRRNINHYLLWDNEVANYEYEQFLKNKDLKILDLAFKSKGLCLNDIYFLNTVENI